MIEICFEDTQKKFNVAWHVILVQTINVSATLAFVQSGLHPSR